MESTIPMALALLMLAGCAQDLDSFQDDGGLADPDDPATEDPRWNVDDSVLGSCWRGQRLGPWISLGTAKPKLVVGDIDGDGITDIAVLDGVGATSAAEGSGSFGPAFGVGNGVFEAGPSWALWRDDLVETSWTMDGRRVWLGGHAPSGGHVTALHALVIDATKQQLVEVAEATNPAVSDGGISLWKVVRTKSGMERLFTIESTSTGPNDSEQWAGLYGWDGGGFVLLDSLYLTDAMTENLDLDNDLAAVGHFTGGGRESVVTLWDSEPAPLLFTFDGDEITVAPAPAGVPKLRPGHDIMYAEGEFAQTHGDLSQRFLWAETSAGYDQVAHVTDPTNHNAAFLGRSAVGDFDRDDEAEWVYSDGDVQILDWQAGSTRTALFDGNAKHVFARDIDADGERELVIMVSGAGLGYELVVLDRRQNRCD